MSSDDDDDKDDDTKVWIKIGDIKLTEQHKSKLLEGEWLNDCHIHAIQQLIRLDPDLQHVAKWFTESHLR